MTSTPSTAPPPVGDHRQRLRAGLAEAMRRRDYHEITIADIVAGARTSKRTFYQHYTDKDACLLDLMAHRLAEGQARIAAAVDRVLPWPVQAQVAVTAWLDWVAEDPQLERSWWRATHTMGSAAREMIRGGLEQFVLLVGTLTDTPELHAAGVVPPSRERTVLVIGGLRELVVDALERDVDVRSLAEPATAVVRLLLGPVPGA